MSKKKKILLITVVSIVLFIGIAYAYLTQSLSSNVQVTIPNYAPLCKKATVPHIETCQSDSSFGCRKDGYNEYSPINYGNLSSNSGTLKSGDAFDCDVNGDGTYDHVTERFYYITDLSDDSNVAVLMYYSTVYGGVANKTTTYFYGTYTGGPITARAQLPKTSQWTNVTLVKGTQRIRAENDYTSVIIDSKTYGFPQSFSYSGYAARLITYQEINSACQGDLTLVGSLKDCNYLLEGTLYSNTANTMTHIITQTPVSTKENMVYEIGVLNRYLPTMGASNSTSGAMSSAKPVIEVPKSRIVY